MNTDFFEQEKIPTLKEAVELLRAEKGATETYVHKLEQYNETLCHELRGPIQGVLGHCESLESHLETLESLLNGVLSLDPKITIVLASAKKSVLGIQASAKIQLGITNQLLDLSKIEAHKSELTLKPFFLNQTVQAVIAIFEPQFSAKNIGKVLNLPEKDKQFLGDATRISQILINLFTNALKFTHEGNIELRVMYNAYSDFTEICFVLTDTGVGMTEEESSHLFDKFYQVQHEDNSNSSGSGLGLCIAKNLIELMQGRILVKSQKWKGTTIEVTIRCKEFSPQLTYRDSPPQYFFAGHENVDPVPSSHKLHILIVDDNETNQHIIGAYLKKGGYDYSVASNGKEALEMYGREFFNIILMDICMSDMDGIETTQQIRLMEKENPKRPSVIIIGLSAAVEAKSIENALSAGMSGYLTKPVESRALLEKISACFSATPSAVFNV